MKNAILFFACVILGFGAIGQTLNGMSSGNYAGIAGLAFNPASIVDSRYKFDLNLAGAQYYFHNNYLYMKPLLFARRMLQNNPYNNSYEAVKKDLIQPVAPPPVDKVFARQSTEFQIPLSFMLTTGKRSAIALNLRNRYELAFDNMNPETATMLYNQLDDKSLKGKTMQNNGFVNNFMNWQEVGFTYGRTLLNANKHFFKAAVTAKWLGGNAASYIQADQLSVAFPDNKTMTLTSPNIQYARTARADFDLFDRRGLFTDLEAQSIGWDVGLVYEFRGRIGNFRYTDEDFMSRLRRDKNKYTVRLGIAINDVGSLDFDRLPLTRDHSANFANWNFSQVKANNLSDWDTAYSKKVTYLANGPGTFSVKLPTAAIVNLDLHLFSGFYVNAAAQRTLNIGKETTTKIFAPEWFAITPRFEGRWFGLYVPFLIRESTTQIGATVRLGPVYVGSNNLLALVQNPMVPTADVHAGIRLSIAYGKPTKIVKAMEKNSGLRISEDYERELDSVNTKTSTLETRVALLEKMMDSSYRTPPVVIVNNYISDSLGIRKVQTQVGQTQPVSQKYKSAEPASPTYTKAQIDSLRAEDEKMRKAAEEKLKQEGVEAPKDPGKKKSKKEAGTTSSQSDDASAKKESKKEQKKRERYEKEQQQYNKAIEEELRKMRKQQAITSTALVGAVAANAAVDANANKQEQKTDTIMRRDTVVVEKIKRDTVYIRDTVNMQQQAAKSTMQQPIAPPVSASGVQPPELRTARIYFASGSAVIGKNYTQVLNKVAGWMLQHPDRRVMLTGVTDATGSPELNKKLAGQRIDAVRKALQQRGIDPDRFESSIQVSATKTKQASASNRRVDMSAL